MHAGNVKTSIKLKALYDALSDRQWHTARELRIMTAGLVEAVSARLQELKAEPNNCVIKHVYSNGQHRYKLMQGLEGLISPCHLTETAPTPLKMAVAPAPLSYLNIQERLI